MSAEQEPLCEWVGGKRGDGKPGGLLKAVSAQDLGATAIRGALEKTGTKPENVDHLVMGYALKHAPNLFTEQGMQD